MKILAISEPTAAARPDGVDQHLAAEITRAKAFYLEGFIEQAYMDHAYTRAFLILESPSVDDARARIATYPRVVAGLIRFTLIPLVGMPAVADAERDRGAALPPWWPGRSPSQET